jgi:hypothetical protein
MIYQSSRQNHHRDERLRRMPLAAQRTGWFARVWNWVFG